MNTLFGNKKGKEYTETFERGKAREVNITIKRNKCRNEIVAETLIRLDMVSTDDCRVMFPQRRTISGNVSVAEEH